MYQRKFYPEERDFSVPENYSGIAIEPEDNDRYIEEESVIPSMTHLPSADTEEQTHCEPPQKEENGYNPWEREAAPACETATEPMKHEGRGFGDLLSKSIPSFGKNLLSSMKNFGFGIPSFGIEELLILGAVLILFFSQNGDKECALMLLALLFIT